VRSKILNLAAANEKHLIWQCNTEQVSVAVTHWLLLSRNSWWGFIRNEDVQYQTSGLRTRYWLKFSLGTALILCNPQIVPLKIYHALCLVLRPWKVGLAIRNWVDGNLSEVTIEKVFSKHTYSRKWMRDQKYKTGWFIYDAFLVTQDYIGWQGLPQRGARAASDSRKSLMRLAQDTFNNVRVLRTKILFHYSCSYKLSKVFVSQNQALLWFNEYWVEYRDSQEYVVPKMEISLWAHE
jgi:hypothetical protein